MCPVQRHGTAMAIQLARRGTPVRLWGRNEAELAAMQQARVNTRYLPGCHFPKALTATSDLETTVQGAQHLLIVVPSHALRETLERIAPLLGPEQGLACACKGLEPGTGRLVHEVVAHVLGEARLDPRCAEAGRYGHAYRLALAQRQALHPVAAGVGRRRQAGRQHAVRTG